MLKEGFIKKAKEFHGDKYSYELVPDEFNANGKIKIICPIHGEFEQCARIHYSKSGCPKCMLEKKEEKETHNNVSNGVLFDYIVKRADAIHHGKYRYDKFFYKGLFAKSTIICPKHGEFKMSMSKHLCGKGCPECDKDAFSDV